MEPEQVFTVDINDEIDRYFDDSSLPGEGAPLLIVFMGGVAAGKTTMRRERFSRGYVPVDAAEIFLSLSRGKYYDFPSHLEELLEIIGSLVARRAIRERRHIVIELIGAEFEPVKELIDAVHAIGYKANLQGLTCDIDEAQRRNLARGDDNISCYYAEPFQRRWLLEAARAAVQDE